MADFSLQLTFHCQIEVFANISSFCHRIRKISISAERSLKIDINRCKYFFCSSSGSGDIREKRTVESTGINPSPFKQIADWPISELFELEKSYLPVVTSTFQEPSAGTRSF